MQQIIKSSNLISDVENTIDNIRHDKLFIITDEHTHIHCLPPLLAKVAQIRDATEIVIPANDTNKTITSLEKVWKVLTENGATRHSLLINLGEEWSPTWEALQPPLSNAESDISISLPPCLAQ